MVHVKPTFRSLTFPFVLVIIDAVDVDDAFVVLLARLALDLDSAAWRSAATESGLALPTLQQDLLLVLGAVLQHRRVVKVGHAALVVGW